MIVVYTAIPNAIQRILNLGMVKVTTISLSVKSLIEAMDNLYTAQMVVYVETKKFRGKGEINDNTGQRNSRRNCGRKIN